MPRRLIPLLGWRVLVFVSFAALGVIGFLIAKHERDVFFRRVDRLTPAIVRERAEHLLVHIVAARKGLGRGDFDLLPVVQVRENIGTACFRAMSQDNESVIFTIWADGGAVWSDGVACEPL